MHGPSLDASIPVYRRVNTAIAHHNTSPTIAVLLSYAYHRRTPAITDHPTLISVIKKASNIIHSSPRSVVVFFKGIVVVHQFSVNLPTKNRIIVCAVSEDSTVDIVIFVR